MEKMEYETPTLTVVGTFEEITQNNTRAGSLDRTFPAGTPGSQLTFS